MKKAMGILSAFAVMAVGNNGVCATANTEKIIQQQGYCQGDPGYGISNIPLEQQLAEFLSDTDLTTEQKVAK